MCTLLVHISLERMAGSITGDFNFKLFLSTAWLAKSTHQVIQTARFKHQVFFLVAGTTV